MPPEGERQLAREIYKEMVEIKSGYTTGATTPVAEAAARRLKAAGFPDADIFVGGAIPTKANLVVRYRGTGRNRPLLLLAHIDVVEAKREDWTMDPFTLTETRRLLLRPRHGDDKAQAAVWIANLIRYKREGFKPDRDIIVALTADEEGGGPYNGVAVAAQEQARPDRRGVLPERRRLGRVGRRQADLERRAGEREVRHQLPARGDATRAATARCRCPTTRSITWPARSTGCRSSRFRSRPTR